MVLNGERETVSPHDVFGVLIGSILNVVHQSLDTITIFRTSLMVHHALSLRERTRLLNIDNAIIN